MLKFIPLKELRDRVWPLAAQMKQATDMTAVSLPILDFSSETPRAKFMLYYAVPSEFPTPQPSRVSRPYAFFTVDMVSGELVKTEDLLSPSTPKPLIGDGTSMDVINLPVDERRKLQRLFFSRCEEAVQVYMSKSVNEEQAYCLHDLLELYEIFMEPPFVQDYEAHGKPFFDWLRANAKKRPLKQ